MRALRSALLSCLIGLGACGVDSLADDEAESRLPDTNGVKLASSYRLVLRSNAVFADRETAERTEMVTRIEALATVVQKDTKVRLIVEPCSVTLPPVRGHQPVVPAATLARASLELAGKLGGTTDDPTLSTSPAALTLGARLSDPIGDDLPASASDRRVTDDDDDGRPGVSIGVSLFNVYVAIRLVVALDGDLEQKGAGVKGKASMRLDQAILGDSVPFVDVAEEVEAAAKKHQLVSTSNTFQMTRTAAQSCEAL